MTETELITIVRLIGFFIVAFILWWAYKLYRSRTQHFDNPAHPYHRRSALNGGDSDHEYGDFEHDSVEMYRTSRLNPGLFGKSSIPPSAKELPNIPQIHLPLTIYPKIGQQFTGKNIAELISNFGLQRCENGTYVLMRTRQILMTMLNLQKPGTFPETLEEMSDTKGIMLVLQLPHSQDAVEDYETFYAVANEMTIACGGRLCTHEGITMQSKERQRYLMAAQEFQAEYDNWLATHQSKLN